MVATKPMDKILDASKADTFEEFYKNLRDFWQQRSGTAPSEGYARMLWGQLINRATKES